MKNLPQKNNHLNINDIINSIGEVQQEITTKKMRLAVRIANVLESRGIQKQNLAKLLGKHPSEISKWLSGGHNFTVDTLFLIEDVLNIHLVQLEEIEKVSSASKTNISFSININLSNSCLTPGYNSLVQLFEFKSSNPNNKNQYLPITR